MNLKESIISSSFFHVILFLLIAAASSYTTSFSGNLQNIISVDLAGEDKNLPDADSNSADELLLTQGSPAIEDLNSLNQAIDSPPEELIETPEPEKNVASDTESAKIENTEKPSTQTRGFTSLEAYHQFIMMHRKLFVQKAGARVNELLGEALEQNQRQFFGGTATVRLQFDPTGHLRDVLVDSESPELKAFIEEIGWSGVPAPAEYSLRFTGVQITFIVLEGYMRYTIDALF